MNDDSVRVEASGAPPRSGGNRARRRYGQLLAETQLTKLFNHILEQPTPSEFLDLLQRIEVRCPQA